MMKVKLTSGQGHNFGIFDLGDLTNESLQDLTNFDAVFLDLSFLNLAIDRDTYEHQYKVRDPGYPSLWWI
ncbi:hypothetical protein DPMN_069250 [Dreissena polymorpha]|uniref:Uncharacterized protein n=1 Tax=Dreissena polymorpha TaxID=45954 RepID=A0A9D3YYR3_DREPO|nr:hypothetical protein DPMN_069250 [Dreissena polymorpha]